MITDIYLQLRRDEGEELFAYQDSKGLWTIGGRNCMTARFQALELRRRNLPTCLKIES